MIDTIKDAAHAVAAATAMADTASENLAAAHRHTDDLRDRRATLVTERDALAATHRTGSEIDSGRLAILSIDIADLEGMIDTASAAAAAAQAKADQARAEVATKRDGLERECAAELLAKLMPHADALGDTLLAALAEITAAGKRLGHSRPDWFPRSALAEALHRLHLMAAGIPGALR